MNCSQAQQCLQERLDGQASVPAELTAHLASCGDCRQLHAAAGRLLTGLRKMRTPAPPRDLHARVVAEVLADRAERLSFRRRLTAVCAVAAGLILAVATAIPFLQRPATTPSMVVTPPTRPQPVAQAPKPSLRGSFTQAGLAFAAITRRTADETVGQSRLLLPETVPAPLPVPEDVPAIEGTTGVWAGASQGMSTGLEPITNSARRAFSMLLREGTDEKR